MARRRGGSLALGDVVPNLPREGAASKQVVHVLDSLVAEDAAIVVREAAPEGLNLAA